MRRTESRQPERRGAPRTGTTSRILDLAWPAIQEFGLSFIWANAWDPVTQDFGGLIFVYGTVVTSLIALVLATPLSIAIALFLTEIAPRRVAAPAVAAVFANWAYLVAAGR